MCNTSWLMADVPCWNMFFNMKWWKMRIDTVIRYLHVLRPFVWQEEPWLIGHTLDLWFDFIWSFDFSGWHFCDAHINIAFLWFHLFVYKGCPPIPTFWCRPTFAVLVQRSLEVNPRLILPPLPSNDLDMRQIDFGQENANQDDLAHRRNMWTTTSQ